MNLTNKILVVDDHLQHRQTIARILSRQGFEPVEVASGAEAINLLATEPVTAVVSDMEMPGMSGAELLQHLDLRYPQLPVVLITPFYDADLRDTAVAWGAAAVLERPFSGAQLVAALRFALTNSGELEGIFA